MKNSRKNTAELLREQGQEILAAASRLQSATAVLPLNVVRGSQGGEDANLRSIRAEAANISARIGAVTVLCADLSEPATS